MLKSDSGTAGDNIVHVPPPLKLSITLKTWCQIEGLLGHVQ